MQPVSIPTRWAASVDPANAWPEYPRPHMVRPHWQNLNGLWRYAITVKDSRAPDRYEGQILVPYPLESALSGVAKRLTGTLLHFGAFPVGLRGERPDVS